MPLILLRLLPYAIAVAVVLGALGLAYSKGRAAAEAKAAMEALKIELAAEKASVVRHKEALKATEDAKAAEAKDAADRESVLNEQLGDMAGKITEQASYIEYLKTEGAIADAAEAALEADLTSLAKDKETADALLAKARAARRMDCRASDRDAAADRGMFRHR
jgi:chromosome segregation ATPase